jgi:hypothetical protein
MLPVACVSEIVPACRSVHKLQVVEAREISRHRLLKKLHSGAVQSTILLFKQEGEYLTWIWIVRHMDVSCAVTNIAASVRQSGSWSFIHSFIHSFSQTVSQSVDLIVRVIYLQVLQKLIFLEKANCFSWVFGASRFSCVLNDKSRNIVA